MVILCYGYISRIAIKAPKRTSAFFTKSVNCSMPSWCMMTNNPLKRAGLEGYGLRIDEIVPIVIEPNPYNERYLETKQNRMHHKLGLCKH